MEGDKELNQFVWVKSMEYPYWPGLIMTKQEDTIVGAQHVFFFGTHDYFWVREEFILPYIPNKEKFHSKCDSPKFKAAIQEIEKNIVQAREDPNYTAFSGRRHNRKRIKYDVSKHTRKRNKSSSATENVPSTSTSTFNTNRAVSTIGIINTKVIGDIIAEKLSGQNYTINVWNPTEKEITTRLLLVNYKSSPCDVLQNSDVIFICLKDQEAVLDVLKDDFKLDDSRDCTLRNKRLLLCTMCHPEVINDINNKIEKKGGSLLDVVIKKMILSKNEETLLLNTSGNEVLYDVCHSSFFKILGSSYYHSELGYATKMNLCLSIMATVCKVGLEECSSLAEALCITKEEYSGLASGIENYLTEKWNLIKQKNFARNEKSVVDVQSTMEILLDNEVGHHLKVHQAIYNIIAKCVSLNYGYSDISIIFGCLRRKFD